MCGAGLGDALHDPVRRHNVVDIRAAIRSHGTINFSFLLRCDCNCLIGCLRERLADTLVVVIGRNRPKAAVCEQQSARRGPRKNIGVTPSASDATEKFCYLKHSPALN